MTPRARVSLLNREGLVQPLHGAGMAKSLDTVVMIGSPRLVLQRKIRRYFRRAYSFRNLPMTREGRSQGPIVLTILAPGRYELLTEKQSEMLGVLYGDGSVSKNHGSFRIAVTGHKFDDSEYLIGRVRPMFKELFQTSLKVLLVKDENTIILYAYSKQVALTLHEWGMPLGRKKLSQLTPAVALDEISFVRGLFDTDGCVYRKYGPYRQIQFKFASTSLVVYLRECLARLGFHPTSIASDDTKFRFYLSRQGEVDHFFRVVKPKNPKHLKRFRNAPRKRSYRLYTRRSGALRRSGPTKPYSNNFAQTRSVGQPMARDKGMGP